MPFVPEYATISSANVAKDVISALSVTGSGVGGVGGAGGVGGGGGVAGTGADAPSFRMDRSSARISSAVTKRFA